MSFVVAMLLVGLAGCLEPTPGASVGGATDVVVETRDGATTEFVRVVLVEQQFTVCECHHGCGPGLDGVVVFDVDVPPGQTVVIRLESLAWAGDGGIVAYKFGEGSSGHWNAEGFNVNGLDEVLTGSLSASTTVRATLYADQTTQMPEGDYTVLYRFTANGNPVGPVRFENVRVAQADGC